MHRYISKTLWNCLLEFAIKRYERNRKIPHEVAIAVGGKEYRHVFPVRTGNLP